MISGVKNSNQAWLGSSIGGGINTKSLGNTWGVEAQDGFTHMCAWMEMIAGRLNSTHGLPSYMVLCNDTVTQGSQRESISRGLGGSKKKKKTSYKIVPACHLHCVLLISNLRRAIQIGGEGKVLPFQCKKEERICGHL